MLTQDFGDWDVVIVGAGSAGCVLANRLSADPKCKVLLLEAGGSDNRLLVHVPVGYLYAMGDPSLDWCLKTEAEPGLNGRALNYPRGRVLGGCSSINGMIYMRGQARDYDLWRRWAIPAGAGTMFCPISNAPKAIMAGPMRRMARRANCAWNANAWHGPFSMPWPRPRASWAFRAAMISTAATMRVPAISK